jgi:hypothetical protein
VLWARRARKPKFQKSGIEATRDLESLLRELPVPKTRKPKCQNPEISTIVGDSCVVGPGKRGRKFGSQESEREASTRTSGGPKPQNETPKSRSPKIFEGHKNCRGFNCWILVDKNPEKMKSRKFAEPNRVQKT